MRSLLIFLVFLLFAVWARWYYVCKIKGFCDQQEVSDKTSEDTRLKTLQLTQGDSVLLQGFDQFAFDSATVAPRLNKNNRVFIDSLTAYLQRFPEAKLNIQGLYAPYEGAEAPGFFENLGLARADALRSLLAAKGIDPGRVTLDYMLRPDANMQEPLFFDTYIKQDSFARESFSFTDMTFSDANFEFDSDKFNPGQAFLLYADSVKSYLSNQADKTLTIAGHTDNKGTDAYNKDLGLRRAKSAREYLQNMGIRNTISVESKGENVPVATNDTDEGRQKNRRVNFILQ